MSNFLISLIHITNIYRANFQIVYTCIHKIFTYMTFICKNLKRGVHILRYTYPNKLYFFVSLIYIINIHRAKF